MIATELGEKAERGVACLDGTTTFQTDQCPVYFRHESDPFLLTVPSIGA